MSTNTETAKPADASLSRRGFFMKLGILFKLGINEWPMPGRIVRRATYEAEYHALPRLRIAAPVLIAVDDGSLARIAAASYAPVAFEARQARSTEFSWEGTSLGTPDKQLRR